jgi:type IV fimbrial biogenesis protein FimT
MGIIRRKRPAPGGHRASHGFTLIELMVTLGVLAVVIGIGIPLFTTMTNGNRLTGAANELVGAFQIARSEAIRSNARTVLCQSADGLTCSNAAPWRGWIVFTDANANNVPEAAEVRRVGTIEVPLEVRGSGNIVNNRITFRGDGLAYSNNALLAANIRVCLPTTQPETNIRELNIAIGGRIAVRPPINGAGVCNAAFGNN